MVLKRLKKTLEALILAASIAYAPASVKAFSTYDSMPDSSPQSEWISGNKDAAKAIVFGSNVLLGCLKSGIGSYNNDKGFWAGCGKGAFAGTVMFFGEYLSTLSPNLNQDKKTYTGNIHGSPAMSIGGKFIHDLGVSISDNVMRGEKVLSQYQTELGPVTFTFRDSLLPHLSFTLTPAIGIAANLAMGNKFDAKQSLTFMTPVFRMPIPTMEDLNDKLVRGERILPGYAIGNVIAYMPSLNHEDATLSHENNHALYWSKLRFAGDLLQLIPTEKIHPSLEIERVQRWWNAGQDIAYGLMNLPLIINSGSYYYLPQELQAASMEKGIQNKEIFYLGH